MENHDQHRGIAGIIAWFTCNPVAANLLMACIIVCGIMGVFTIRKEFIPEFTTGAIMVEVPFPGAVPAQVESGVCIKVEESLLGINGIKRMFSTAAEGIGVTRVEVDNDVDISDMLEKVRSRVNGISTFPEEAEKPVIAEETTRDGVLWLVLSGDMDERSLKALAEDIRDELIAMDEISQVELHGTRSPEISVEMSEAALRMYSLTLEDVAQAIVRSSIDLPAGAIKTLAGDILVRTRTRASGGDDLARMPLVTDPVGARVTLGDVARITDGFEEADWFLRYHGTEAVGLQVFRVGDENTLLVSKAAREYAEDRQMTLPPGVTISPIADASGELRDQIKIMFKNLVMGGALVFVLLLLFLHHKVAFWVVVGIPVCFLGTIWLMPLEMVNMSINTITLFGFIVVIGILVDDAIVIGENVYTTISRDGPGERSVIRGAAQVAVPVTFGVLTTMAAFVPMLMIPGINGKIWSGIGLTVILCLFFSLVESKLILPAHLARMRYHAPDTDSKGLAARARRAVENGQRHFVDVIYRPVLACAIRNRYTTLAGFTALAIVTAGMFHGGIVRFVFFPDIASDVVMVDLTMAAGTPLVEKLQAASRVEAAAREVNESIRSGQGFDRDVIRHVISLSNGDTGIWVYAELMRLEDLPLPPGEIVGLWRERTGTIPGCTDLVFHGTVADAGSALDLQLEGDDPDLMNAAAEALKARLASFEGVHDIRDTHSLGKRELQVGMLPSAEVLGLRADDLARHLRYGFHGAEAQTLQRGRDEVKVVVRYTDDERCSVADLDEVRVKTPSGELVPFTSVASVRTDRSPCEIHRVDRRRVINVTAEIDKTIQEPQRVIGEAQTFMESHGNLYPGVTCSLSGEARETKKTTARLASGMVLALMLIYAMMAIPLKSYFQPLVIMSAIPFGIVGAVLGHLFLGLPVSILSLCGIIALAGVVVNDGLVMVDFINRSRSEGASLSDAVMNAGGARFRAIILTTLTTFAGLMPMILEKSLQAQFLIPMSVSLAFGVLFASVLTLVLIPCLYLVGADITAALERIFSTGSLRHGSQEHHETLETATRRGV